MGWKVDIGLALRPWPWAQAMNQTLHWGVCYHTHSGVTRKLMLVLTPARTHHTTPKTDVFIPLFSARVCTCAQGSWRLNVCEKDPGRVATFRQNLNILKSID